MALVMVKPGLIVKRSGATFTQRHIMPMPPFLLKEAHFSIRLSREALDPKTVSGLIVKLIGASHHKKQGLIKKHPVINHTVLYNSPFLSSGFSDQFRIQCSTVHVVPKPTVGEFCWCVWDRDIRIEFTRVDDV